MQNIMNTWNDLLYVKCVCPRCFREFYLGDCRIVSQTGKELRPAPRGIQQIQARCNPISLNTDFFVTNQGRRECPRCKYHLPYNIAEVPMVVLAIVGDTLSGKSHYLASFIHQFEQERNHGYLYSFECLTKDVEQVIKMRLLTPVGSNQAIGRTAKAPTHIDPLIYKVSGKKTFNLMIYDIAGEDLVREDRLVEVGRFVFYTNALVFITDPATIDHIFNNIKSPIKNIVDGEYSGTRHLLNPLTRFQAIMSLFQRFHNVTPDDLQYLPIAIMLSKSDLLGELEDQCDLAQLSLVQEFKQRKKIMQVPRQSYTPQYEYGLNLNQIDTIDTQLRDLLRKSKQGGLVKAVENFAMTKFFATSATGEPSKPPATPTAGAIRTFDKVTPYRCIDPVLWILHQLGLGN